VPDCRDIKPANFLVGRAEGYDEGFRERSMATSEIYLADFGLAEDRGFSREVSGSSGFAAPEQGRGQLQDHKVDSYAFGVTILHVL
jgi:serine/threonine protein kinase